AMKSLKERRPDLLAQHPALKAVATKQLARAGDLAGLQWARENAFFEAAAVGEGAAESGQLAVLQWARENAFPQTWYCETLARNGHLECLKWALANGKQLSPILCAMAARRGHLRVLQ